MVDFTSALYLGFCHPSSALRPWTQLTTGAPAALIAPPPSAAVGRALAALLACERAALTPSTLHLFWDLFPLLAGPDDAIYVDSEAYPIARWGVDRAAARGVATQSFAHRDATSLRRLVDRDGRRPLVVVDGLCPDCGRAAPVPAYLEVVEGRGGRIVIDDTQALGIVGTAPGPAAPFGFGGGGSLRLHGLRNRNVIVAASLAKAFGAPLAVLAGAAGLVVRYEAESDTRVHCSPPSTAALRAAERALALNDIHGDVLRLRLALLVRRFRHGLTRLGLFAAGGRFPFQTIARDLHGVLLAQGVRTVRRRNGVTFLITTLHGPADIDLALHALDVATRGGGSRQERRVLHEHHPPA